MGIETNRIETEFIIKSVCEKNIPVNLHHGKNIIQCSFEEYDLDKTIKVKIGADEKESLKPEEKIKIYFSYYSHVMTFISEIRKNNSELIINYPEVLYKNLSRKYERVKPPEDSLNLT